MLRILIYIVFVSACVSLKAQSTFQSIIVKNDSTSPNFTAHSVTESNDGNIYSVGTISPGGWYSKIRLVKINESGNLLWDTTYAHTSAHEFFPEVMSAHDEGIILGTLSLSYVIDDKDSTQDILIWKINVNGEIEWQQVFSAIYFDDMIRTKDGGYLFLGQIREEWSNQLDIIVYKTDSKGNIQWTKQLGEPYLYDDVNSLKEIDGRIYVCGQRSPDGWSIFDGVMYELDSLGDVQWEILLPHDQNEDKIRINSMFKFDNRYFYKATGGLFEFDNKSGVYWSVPDSVDFVFTSSGKGYTYSIECGAKKVKSIIPNSGNYFLKLYDNLVEPHYETLIPEISGSYAEMIVSNDGGIIVLTSYGDNMQITKTDCLGNVDHWSDACNSKIPEGEPLLIYPNPSENEIQIDASFDFNEVVIYSPNGQHISYTNPCSCQRQTLDISDLAAGVYIVRISSDEQFAISKFVKI